VGYLVATKGAGEIQNLTRGDIYQSMAASAGNELANVAVGVANLLIAMSPGDAELIAPVKPFTPVNEYMGSKGAAIVDGALTVSAGRGLGKGVAGLIEASSKAAMERALLAAADKPVNKYGLSEAARAIDKHATRSGSTFEPLTGGVAEKNAAARAFVKDTINNPQTVRTELSRGGVEYRAPSGQGVRFDADGSFSGVLDPRR
jgi:hypothetical protein